MSVRGSCVPVVTGDAAISVRGKHCRVQLRGGSRPQHVLSYNILSINGGLCDFTPRKIWTGHDGHLGPFVICSGIVGLFRAFGDWESFARLGDDRRANWLEYLGKWPEIADFLRLRAQGLQ